MLTQIDLGVPERLRLTADAFAEMRACLEAQGLPGDLFYSEQQARRIIEPVEVRAGAAKILGVVLGEMTYSPGQWRSRDAAAIEARQVPSEAERRAALSRACFEFAQLLHLRLRELAEPGRPAVTVAEQAEVELLLKMVQLVLSRALGLDQIADRWRADVARAAQLLGPAD